MIAQGPARAGGILHSSAVSGRPSGMTEALPATPRSRTFPVRVGGITVGGGAPVVVQSMANTDTADAATTAAQVLDLARAGSELVRITVNVDEAAAAVPEIRRRLDDAGWTRDWPNCCRAPGSSATLGGW